MKNIDVKILNPEAAAKSEKLMVCAARLTQRGEKIKTMDDFMALYEKSYTEETAQFMAKLPHPTLQKFGAINIVVVGASRRFLAQITRHQNEVKFMSASLQYSNYADEADFVVPYELYEKPALMKTMYLTQCKDAMDNYKAAIEQGLDNDAAGYMAPQGLANVLIISATPYQWKHMIAQRTCRRNTPETRYVMLRIWELLYKLSPILFECSAPPCCFGDCPEMNMSCGKPIWWTRRHPAQIIQEDFPLLDDKKHLCSHCSQDFATCPPGGKEYGNGPGGDNVVKCEQYKTDSGR